MDTVREVANQWSNKTYTNIDSGFSNRYSIKVLSKLLAARKQG